MIGLGWSSPRGGPWSFQGGDAVLPRGGPWSFQGGDAVLPRGAVALMCRCACAPQLPHRCDASLWDARTATAAAGRGRAGPHQHRGLPPAGSCTARQSPPISLRRRRSHPPGQQGRAAEPPAALAPGGPPPTDGRAGRAHTATCAAAPSNTPSCMYNMFSAVISTAQQQSQHQQHCPLPAAAAAAAPTALAGELAGACPGLCYAAALRCCPCSGAGNE